LRVEYRLAVERNKRQAEELRLCKNDICHWVNQWAYTFDPRINPSTVPFDLFPKQEDYLRWLQERDAKQEDGLAEKSRDMGLTWLCCAFALHGWLFREGYKVCFGSRKLDLVDKKGDMDSIFEKIRFLISNLPEWMLPKGFVRDTHDCYTKILNPANGSAITGEGGSSIGRGGRASVYFVDEAAFLEQPDSIDRSLSQTTRCRIDVSTPNGPGNPFAKKRFSGTVPVFTFHWAQPLDARILTPAGWRLMGDLSIGDLVIGSNGKATEVVGVYPQGVKTVYRVLFNDGSSTECCADHLWSVIPYGNQRATRRHIRRVLPLRDLMTDCVGLDTRGYKRHRYQIPVTQAVDFSPRDLGLHPYVLGCLLGDGSLPKLTSRPIMLSSEDKELASLVGERLPDGCRLRHDGGLQYRISADESHRGGAAGRGWHNPVNEAIRNLGLAGRESHNKFIPLDYLLASPSDRLDLLCGLMDTDGGVSKNDPGSARFSTTSPDLVEGVTFLTQSLGGVAKTYEKPAAERIFPGDRKCSCRKSYNVQIRLPGNVIPFKLSRKAKSYVFGGKYVVRRSLVGIEEVGEKPCQCIKVAAQDGLYLTDDLIVTHNSDDPRKGKEWYESEKKRINNPIIVAQELDIDYSASIEGICIPATWVRAAVDLHLPASGPTVAGFDVADGGDDLCVVIPRTGPLVGFPVDWNLPNTTQNSYRAADAAERMNATALNYDSVAVGAGVKGTYNTSEREFRFRTNAISAGEHATDTMWPDHKTSRERFGNLGTELWWLMRARFEKAFEFVTQGIQHPPEEMISIPNHPQLIAELSSRLVLHTEGGKVRLESKKEMRKRGVKSPNFADALSFTMYPHAQFHVPEYVQPDPRTPSGRGSIYEGYGQDHQSAAERRGLMGRGIIR
jgi:hypothetical protein